MRRVIAALIDGLFVAGGIYQIQNNSVTPSWLTLPVSN
jgi:hypothetical protein